MLPTQCAEYLTGGRRMGRDRREFTYACCIPERRSGVERRSGRDRRESQRLVLGVMPSSPPVEAVGRSPMPA